MNSLFRLVKKEIFWSCLTACLATFLICLIFFTYIFCNTIRQNDEILNTFIGYLANATDDEYDEIAQEIRYDLIYRVDKKQYIQYIPNTSTNCPTCKSIYEYEYPIYFLANNTGKLYSIDTVNKLTGEQFSHGTGFDEISQTRFSVIYDKKCTVRISQEKDVVSVTRMKTIFCDDCIDKILAAIEYKDITSFVIFLPQEQAFYPISENIEIPLENIATEIYYDKETREMITELSW